jgi:uncharacterized protein
MGSQPPPPPPPQVRPALRWGLGDAVLALVVALVAGVVATELAIAITHVKRLSNGNYPETTPVLVAAVVGQYGAWFALILRTSVRKGLGTLRADFGFVVDLVHDWWLVPVGFAGSFAAGVLLYPITRYVHHAPQQIVQDLGTAHGAKLAIIAVTAVLVAPVVEELFFRGLLQRSLARRFGPAAAIAASSVLFGLAHFEALQLPALILFGVVLGGLAHWTGRLGPGIVAHATFNALTVLTFTLSH